MKYTEWRGEECTQSTHTKEMGREGKEEGIHTKMGGEGAQKYTHTSNAEHRQQYTGTQLNDGADDHTTHAAAPASLLQLLQLGLDGGTLGRRKTGDVGLDDRGGVLGDGAQGFP